MSFRFANIAKSIFFLGVAFISAFRGLAYAQEFPIRYYIPLSLQFDVSLPGLLSLCWAVSLIGAATLLIYLALLVGFGATRRVWSLGVLASFLAAIATTPRMEIGSGTVGIVIGVGELFLLFHSHKSSRKTAVRAGILFIPYSLYLLLEGIDQIILIKAISPYVILRLVLAALPFVCVWFVLRSNQKTHSKPDVQLHTESPKNEVSLRYRLMNKFDIILAATTLVVVLAYSGSGYLAVWNSSYDGHQAEYGHPPTNGLHADIVEIKGSIGIPGVTKLYEAHLFNFSSIPRIYQTCDYLDDTASFGSELAYVVQKWSDEKQAWENLNDISKGFYCGPAPLSKIVARTVNRVLLPGQYATTNWEATAGRTEFSVGDKARFVVFVRYDDTSMDVAHAIPTREFLIDEELEDRDTPFKLQH